MEFNKWLKLLVEKWRTILIFTVLCGGLSLIICLASPPQYQSRTQLYVSVRSVQNATGDLTEGIAYSRQMVNNFVDVATSGIVLQPVFDELGLGQSVKTLADNLSVTSREELPLIDIVARDRSPDVAAKIATAVGRSLERTIQDDLTSAATGDGQEVALTITQHAQVPNAPYKPKTLEVTAVSLLLGFVLGTGAAVLRETLDTRIHSSKDAEQTSKLPVLGEIFFGSRTGEGAPVMQVAPSSPIAESYRTLRTNLRFLQVGERCQTFIITSPGQSEGKATTSINLALSLAEAGTKVVLIEGDLRLPSLHSRLGTSGELGLTDILVGRASPEDVLQLWGQPSLNFLPAGRIPPNPSELLGSDKMKVLLEHLRGRFDAIIIDAPPILAVTDAAVIDPHRGQHLLVVDTRTCRKPELKSAQDSLRKAQANVAGLIVTKG